MSYPVDPMQLIQMIKQGQNPQQLLMSILSQNQNQPMYQNLLTLVKENKTGEIEKIAKENNAKVHLPSGAIVGLDGIKAVAKFGLKEVSLVTRKSPKSLGKEIDTEEVLFEGKASDAVKEFPLNINVAATISIACHRDIDVKIIVDPKVDRNVHEITAKGDFGEFKTITMNYPCSANPKTSMLAALSAIRLLKSFNETISVGM